MAGFSQVVLVCANQTAKNGESNLHMPWVFSFAAAQRPQPLLSCMHSCQSSSNLPNIKRKQGLENYVPPAHVGVGQISDRYPTLQDQHISTHFFVEIWWDLLSCSSTLPWHMAATFAFPSAWPKPPVVNRSRWLLDGGSGLSRKKSGKHW